MKRQPTTLPLALLVLAAGLALLCPAANAQYVITQSVFGCGGGTTADGDYMIYGTAGQPVGVEGQTADGMLIGFWYIPELPTEPVHDLRNYGLVALNSLRLDQKVEVHSGYVGVVDYGQAPFLKDGVELSVAQKVIAAEGVDLSAPRVRIGQKANIAGTLYYAEPPDIGKNAHVGGLEQEDSDFWPVVGLPEFLAATPGTQDVTVRKKGSEVLSPGAYGEVRVQKEGTLVLTGGTYDILSLDAEKEAQVLFREATVLRVADKLAVAQKATLGPENGTTIGPPDILIHVAGEDGTVDKKGKRKKGPRAVEIGQKVESNVSLYAPNGTVEVGQECELGGAVIGRDVDISQKVVVSVERGWVPQRVYPTAAAKPVALAKRAQHDDGAEPDSYVFGMAQNYPNPFNPTTSIRYSLAASADVRLVVYSVLGQEVRVLVNGLQAPGQHVVQWDGLDARGRQVGSGVYLCRLKADPNVAVQKMVLVK